MKNGNRFLQHSSGRESSRHDDYRSAAKREARRRGAGRRWRLGPQRRRSGRAIRGHRDAHLGILYACMHACMRDSLRGFFLWKKSPLDRSILDRWFSFRSSLSVSWNLANISLIRRRSWRKKYRCIFGKFCFRKEYAFFLIGVDSAHFSRHQRGRSRARGK